jgi:glycosyltransferase involved in cell wall biosynthesis
MKLLVTTQAVDLDDPVLGFFHRWLEEFSKRFESVHVICLKEGRHELPSNVFVHSLGKEGGVSRLKYISRFYRYIWKFRNEYDAVFVHMNPEYIVLGGPLWKLWGKKISLWFVHRATQWQLRFAVRFADAVFTATDESMRINTWKKHVIGHGIDTKQFLLATPPAQQDTILFFGRLDPVKKPETFIDALEELSDSGVKFEADIVGGPTPGHEQYAHDVRNRASVLALTGALSMHTSISNESAPGLYAAHAIYVNLTQAGSLDKTIGEAMASGCMVVAGNGALRGVLPEEFVVDSASPRSVANGIRCALSLSEEQRAKIVQAGRIWVEHEYSLSLLMERIVGILNA